MAESDSSATAAAAAAVALQSWESIMVTYFTGMVLSIFLEGVFLFSAYLYFSVYPNDYKGNKLVVFALIPLTLLDTISYTVYVARMVVNHPLDLNFLIAIPSNPGVYLSPLFAVLTAALCQAFMAWRVIRFARTMRGTWMTSWSWRLKGQGEAGSARQQSGEDAEARWIPAVVLFWVLVIGLGSLWLASTALGLSEFVILMKVQTILDFLLPTGWAYDVWNELTLAQGGCLMVLELAITLCLTLQFRQARTGFAISTHILDHLVTVILRNGALITTLQVGHLILLKTVSHWVGFVPSFVGKIHALTIISILTAPRRANTLAQARYGHQLQAPSVPTLHPGVSVGTSLMPLHPSFQSHGESEDQCLSQPTSSSKSWEKSDSGEKELAPQQLHVLLHDPLPNDNSQVLMADISQDRSRSRSRGRQSDGDLISGRERRLSSDDSGEIDFLAALSASSRA